MPAINVELYLEKLIFKEKDSNIEDDIGTISTPILWQGTNKESIIIPPGSHKMVNMVEIIAPQKISLPDAPKQTEECKLIIGNTESTHKKGTWLATFGLYAQNHKSVNFQVEIEFKGHWKTRLAEMEKQYTMTIKNNTR